MHTVKKTTFAMLLAVAMLSMGVFATSSYALPTYGTPCVAACHHTTPPVGDPSIVPTTTPVPTSTVSLDEAVAPITTSDAAASYTGTATVQLTATDGAGAGVAYMYYSIDGERVHLFKVGTTAKTSFTVAAPKTGTVSHTITFWSQDRAGNVEAPKTATLTVNTVAVTAVKVASRTSINGSTTNIRYGQTVRLFGYVVPNAFGQRVTIQRYVGSGRWVNLTTAMLATHSNYTRTISKMKKGNWYFRTVYSGSSTANGSTSRYVKVVVR